MTLAGGMGVSGDVFVGGSVNVTALQAEAPSSDAMLVGTTLSGTGTLTLGTSGQTTNLNGSVVVGSDALDSSGATFTLGGATATTVNLGGSGATTVAVGGSSTTTVNVGTSAATAISVGQTDGSTTLTANAIVANVRPLKQSFLDTSDASVTAPTADTIRPLNRLTLAGAQTFNLPTGAAFDGMALTIISANTGTKTIARGGSDTIDDGALTSITLTAQYDRVTLMYSASDTNWYIV